MDRFQPLILTTIGAVVLAVCFSTGFVNAQNFEKKVISSLDAPEAIGPYSQGIQVGKTVYLSGQIAIDPKTKQIAADASIEDQTRLALDNLKAVLVAAGLTMDHIVVARPRPGWPRRQVKSRPRYNNDNSWGGVHIHLCAPSLATSGAAPGRGLIHNAAVS